MVILQDLHNQRSNQFIQSIHLNAFCKTHNIEFYHKPFINRYITIYPALKAYQQPKKTQIYLKLLSLIKRITNPLGFISLEDDAISNDYAKQPELFKGKYVFCKGGRLRDYASVIKYRDYFRELFTPAINTDKLKELFLNKESESQVILGVHIRRTDYINYEKGMYFFDDDVYINYIKQVIALTREDTRIILFTDDKNLDFDRYKREFRNILLSKNSIVEDYYLMGQCDYLLSTNSTFTLVASYLGKCKLFRFMGIDEKISDMNVFKECTILDHTDEEAERAGIAYQKFISRKE